MFSLSAVRLSQCRLLPKEMTIPTGVKLVNSEFMERRNTHLDHLRIYPNSHNINIDMKKVRNSNLGTFSDLVKAIELKKVHTLDQVQSRNENLIYAKEVRSEQVKSLDSIKLYKVNTFVGKPEGDQKKYDTNYNFPEAPKPAYLWPSDLTRGVCYFKSTNIELNGATDNNSKKKVPNLEKLAHQLTYDLVNIFLRSPDWNMYHTNMVLEDNIRGKIFEGLDKYVIFVNLMKITAHIRFVYVRFHILNITKNPEQNTIKIRWRIVGLGMVRLIFRYFPDRLWMRGNMDTYSPSWYDGVSTFHVGEDDKIFKHVIDQMDRDDAPVEETLSEKITKRLKPIATPSPI